MLRINSLRSSALSAFRLSKYLLLALIISANANLAFAKVTPAPELESIAPTVSQSKTLQEILTKLQSRHYKELKVDDDLSAAFLDNYLKKLDPNRLFFLQSDIDRFKLQEKQFDDYFRTGDLNAGFDIYLLYRERVVRRLDKVINELTDPNKLYSFEEEEYFPIKRENLPWPKDEKDANELWRKRVKLNLLNLKLAGKTLEEAREIVTKRFEGQKKRLLQQNNIDVFENMVNALTELYDPHTSYLSPRTFENFNINMSLSLEGIGAVLQTEDEFTKVVRLVAGGPASLQGELKPADRIVGVGQGDSGEIVDVVGWRLDDVVQLIRGKKGTNVRLELLPANAPSTGEHKVIKITRNTVKLEDQAAKKAVFDVSDGEKLYKIGVINLPTFYIDFDARNRRDPNYKSSTRDVSRLLSELEAEGVDGIVLDLRNNGGGSLIEAAELTNLFIDKGPVVQIRYSDGQIDRNYRSRRNAQYRGPLVVLINRLSASASEIFAGAIQDYDRALIIGNQSFGKGTVQSVVPLREGQLKITESKFYRVSGDSTQHRGVIPDIEFPLMVDKDEVGESTYDYALPWDQIHSVPHTNYHDLNSLMGKIKSRYQLRAKTDPDFSYLVNQLEFSRNSRNRSLISLSEKQRIAEKDKLEKLSMDLENQRRKAKQLPLYESLEDFRAAEQKEQEDTEEIDTRSTEIDTQGDTLLQEAGNILVDFINLQGKEQALTQARGSVH